MIKISNESPEIPIAEKIKVLVRKHNPSEKFSNIYDFFHNN